jgi:hypothetical protein
MIEGLRALIVTGNYLTLPFDIFVLFVVTIFIPIVSSYLYPKFVI